MKNRRKILESIMAVTMLVFVYICSAKLPALKTTTQIKETSDKEKKVVLLDAGHGGVDPGKISVTGTNEKEINLEIALKVKKYLKKENIQILLTREADEGLYQESDKNKKVSDMKKRCQMATEVEADMLVSIHQNSYQSEGVKGAQVFYYEHSEDGKNLAEIIQRKFCEIVDDQNGRKAKANNNYYLLLNVSCPAVIVECGFLSNWEEAQKLETEQYQKKVAEAISKGILEYFAK